MLTALVNGKEYNIEFDDKKNETGKINGENFLLDLVELKQDAFHLLKDNISYNIDIIDANIAEKKFVIKINEVEYQVEIKNEFDVLLKKMGIADSRSKILELKAPMPGLVVKILVAKGDIVAKGDNLVVLEAMKMENILKSPIDGKIKKINCKKGTAVEKGEILISFDK